MTQMTQKLTKLDMTPFFLCHLCYGGHDTKLSGGFLRVLAVETKEFSELSLRVISDFLRDSGAAIVTD